MKKINTNCTSSQCLIKLECQQFKPYDKYYVIRRNYRYLLYFVLLLPVFIFRDFTPANELKYMSIATEAINNNTWFTFYNHGEIYAEKPPLFFWLIMFSHMIFGQHYIEIIGLFSVIPAIGIVAVMNKWLKEENVLFNPIASELLLLTTAMFTGAILIVRMDMLMSFFIVISLYTFFRIYKNKHKRFEKLLLPVYVFLGVFSKGCMGFIVPLTSILVFLIVKKQLRTFVYYWGWRQWVILLSLSMFWFLGVYIEGGEGYLNDLLFKQTIGRGIDSFHHKEPFWFYFPRMLVTFAPWSILYIVLIWQGIKKRMFRDDIKLFFVVIIVVNTLLLSLISSKLDIYMLPLYPFIVYLGSSLLPCFDKKIVTKIAVIIPIILLVAAFPISFFIESKIVYDYDNIFIVRLALFLLLVAGGLAGFFLKKDQIQKSIITLSFGILCTLFVVSFALPQFNKYLGFRSMAENAFQVAQDEDIQQYMYYKFPTAPNMDVYLGKEVININSINELDSLIYTGEKNILFVRETEMRRDTLFCEWLENQMLMWHEGKYRWYIISDNSTAMTSSNSNSMGNTLN